MSLKLLDAKGLRDKGLNYSRAHLHKLIKAGKFPAPIKFGGEMAHNQWIEGEIDKVIAELIAQRDAKAVA
jgi:predicted DNA-binding transcriptional regulator AlpA